MGLPKKVKAWNLFVNGQCYPGTVSGVKLPKLTRKFEEFRADIMTAPVELDYGHEKLQAGFTLDEYREDIIATWAECDRRGLHFDLRMSEESDDCSLSPIRIVMLGRHHELDFGDLELGKGNKLKIQLSVARFEYYRNGKEKLVLDPEFGIERVNGKDKRKTRRKNLGLGF